MKAATEKISTADTERSKCHLKASKWSKKDIPPSSSSSWY